MDLLEVRLSVLNAAQKRSRTAFFSCVLGSAVVLLLVWNLSFSWSRGLPDHASSSWWEQEIFKEKLKPWSQRYIYTLPLLGISMTTDDIGLMAPFVLLVLTTYNTSSQRIVRTQLLDLLSTTLSPGEAKQSFVVLQSEMVLNSLEGTLPEQSAAEGWPSTRTVYRALIYLPAVAAVSSVCEDIWGAYIEVTPSLGRKLPLILTMPLRDKIVQVTFDCIGLFFTVIVVRFTLEAIRDSAMIRSLVTRLAKQSAEQIPASRLETCGQDVS